MGVQEGKQWLRASITETFSDLITQEDFKAADTESQNGALCELMGRFLDAIVSTAQSVTNREMNRGADMDALEADALRFTRSAVRLAVEQVNLVHEARGIALRFKYAEVDDEKGRGVSVEIVR